jgi:hypothetical protein
MLNMNTKGGNFRSRSINVYLHREQEYARICHHFQPLLSDRPSSSSQLTVAADETAMPDVEKWRGP